MIGGMYKIIISPSFCLEISLRRSWYVCNSRLRDTGLPMPRCLLISGPRLADRCMSEAILERLCNSPREIIETFLLHRRSPYWVQYTAAHHSYASSAVHYGKKERDESQPTHFHCRVLQINGITH